MTNERNAEWRDCVGLDGYEVSNAGQVRRKDTGRVLGQRKNDWGYMRVSVRVDGKSKHRTVHGLVAEAFLGERDGREVNHKNGVKADNDVKNLEAAISTIHHIRVSLKPSDARTAPLYSAPPAPGATA